MTTNQLKLTKGTLPGLVTHALINEINARPQGTRNPILL